jgi:hypothetical protein
MKDSMISLKIDGTLKAQIAALAKAENRSLSNFIEKLLKEEVTKRKASSVIPRRR